MTTLELEKPTTAMNHGTETLPELSTTDTLTETNPDGTAMDQSLPPSRPGTPQISNCIRKRQCVELIDYYTSSIESIQANLRNLRQKPSNVLDGSHLDHVINEHNQRFADYTRLLDLTVSEFSSLGNCEIPGCAVHHTPNVSPVKNNNPDFPQYLNR
ncbi:hypothetical protein TNCV_4186641 [Trichonephila clavipes]|nr:hypothetical protein TNCV_4186641 [Trichonephila clavipes]